MQIEVAIAEPHVYLDRQAELRRSVNPECRQHR